MSDPQTDDEPVFVRVVDDGQPHGGNVVTRSQLELLANIQTWTRVAKWFWIGLFGLLSAAALLAQIADYLHPHK